MTLPITLADPSARVRALEANLHGHIACVHRQAGMVVWDEPALLLADSGLPSDTFNKVARAGLSPRCAQEGIRRAVAYFRQVGRPFAWWVGPSCRPLDIEERLQACGFRVVEREIGMALNPSQLGEPPLPPGLTVERVTSPRQLRDLSQVLAAQWQPPDPTVGPFYQAAAPLILDSHSHLRYFIGYLGGEPVAVSGLYLQGGTGGIYAVATLPAFRGRGFGSRLTWAAAAEARRAGAALVVLQASEQGQRIYRCLGFEPCCFLAEYSPSGDGPADTCGGV